MDSPLRNVTAALLVGGFGTRLKSVVADRPKPLAGIAGKPFLDYQFEQLARAGIRRVVLCTGYRGGQIEDHYGRRFGELALDYSLEPEPLGTGGAVRFALPRLASDDVLVMNGDSYCHADFTALHRFHTDQRAKATLLLTRVLEVERFGLVEFDESRRITAFREKGSHVGAGNINAGVYLMRRDLIERMPDGQALSLEREVFPQWIGGAFYALPSSDRFIDIGTPESYEAAQSFFAALTS